MPTNLKKIYQAFDPAPLSAADSDLYVPLDDVRGSSGLVSRLAKTIRLSDKPTFQLLAGHIGSGKSTELRRVQQELEHGDDRFFTVFCQILEDIDPADADFPEVLMAIIRQVACDLRNRLGIELKPGYFKQRWADVKGLLGSEVTLESLDLSAGLAKVTAAVKSSPSTRNEVRRALEPRTGSWIGAANEVLSEATSRLAKEGYAGLVIIVDDLDKLSVEETKERTASVAERLFLTRHAQLTAFNCHTIYTVPLALAYSCKEREIASRYGKIAPEVVPLTRLHDHNGKKRAAGFERFRAIVARRIEKAGAAMRDVFARSAVLDRVIALSGGHPRALMTFIREALVGGDLPVTAETVNRVAAEAGRGCSRYLHEGHWAVIEQVRHTRTIERTPANDPFITSLLANCLILHYLNDRESYRLNPLLPRRTRN